jgi:cytochrome c-type biogenesis protein CcmH
MAMQQHIRWACILVFVGLFLALTGLLAAKTLVWQDVANDLMSPACPGRTLINCTSGQSEQWRELIRQKVAQGETKEEIIRYFVELQGEEILAAPPKKGFALTAWLLPLFVLLNGAGLIVVLTTRWTRRRPTTAPATSNPVPTSASAVTDHPTSDAYRNRLRSELEEFNR